MSRTLLTSHLPMSWLKTVAFLNMLFMAVTLLTFQSPMSLLKAYARMKV